MSTTVRARFPQQVEEMAEAARWAPSVHNSQPWTFRVVGQGLAVHEDLTRRLPVLDPTGRLRAISCGAAALNAAVALAALEVRPSVSVLPDADDPSLMALVEPAGGRHASAKDLADAWAVRRRRTHRRVHSPEPVDAGVLLDLQRAVRSEGARLTVAAEADLPAVSALLTRAVRDQAGTAPLVQEVESWVRHWGSAEQPVDGIPVGSLGTAPFPVDSIVQEQTEPTAVREGDVAEMLARATLVAVSTSGDERRDWVVAGMALQRLLLRATSADLVVGWADQATQQQGTRAELAEALDLPGHAQVVLRVGHPLVDVPATPRRPLEDVLR